MSISFRYNIDDSVTSKQLPTLILFQDGKEVKRRPVKSAGRDGKVLPFGFTKVRISLLSKSFVTPVNLVRPARPRFIKT